MNVLVGLLVVGMAYYGCWCASKKVVTWFKHIW